MSIKELLALPAGRELDAAVAEIVFGNKLQPGQRAPKYSTSGSALDLLRETELPLAVGRVAKNDPQFNTDRPYYCEERPTTMRHGYRPLRIIAASPEIALCKAACVYVLDHTR